MELKVYGNHKRVPGEFTYRGTEIAIFSLDKGAKHCEKQHDYRSKKCGKCDAAISPSNVFMAFVNETQASEDCDSPEDAFESAKATIDKDEGEWGDGSSGTPDPRKPRPFADALDPRVARKKMIKKMDWGARAAAILKRDAAAEAATDKPK